jgi:hypothetical protein
MFTAPFYPFLILLALIFNAGCEFKRTLVTNIPQATITSNTSNQNNNQSNGPSDGDDVVVDQLRQQSLEDLLDQFLAKFVTQIPGRIFDTTVEYRTLYELRAKEDPNFLALEQSILEKFEDERAFNGLDNKDKIAFMINAYNFFVIRTVYLNLKYEGKMITSIADIDATVFDRKKIFKKKLFTIAGKRNLSLEDIEKNSSDSVWQLTSRKDARVLFALVPAAKGAGILLNQAYRGNKLEDQLDIVTRSSLRLPRFIAVKNDGATFLIHSLFSFHESILTQDINSAGVRNFIQTYRGVNLRGAYEIIPYNWDLNGNVKDINDTNLGDITLPTSSTSPCDRYAHNSQYLKQAYCDVVKNGQESDKYKFNVERAAICILNKSTPSQLRIVGNIEEEDGDSREFRTFIDLVIDGKDIEVKTQKIDEQTTSTTSSFEAKNREITKGKIVVNVSNNEIIQYRLTISQRLRFWSLDMFKKKDQRSFQLNCRSDK